MIHSWKERRIAEVREATVAFALAHGIPLSRIETVYDTKRVRPESNRQFKMLPELSKTGTTAEKAFWTRVVEPSSKKKPRDLEAFKTEIKNYLESAVETGFRELVKPSDSKSMAIRYMKIRNASPREAATYPPAWHALRSIPENQFLHAVRQTSEHITEERKSVLKRNADYLLAEMGNGTYSLAEVAELLTANGRWNFGKTQSQGDWYPTEISEGNEHIPHVIEGNVAARAIENMRQGTNAKNALREAIKESSIKETPEEGIEFTGWVKFEQSRKPEDATQLQKAVKHTSWCTGASQHTAQSQLSRGHFYLYYQVGDPKIAIRTENNQVAEIRGRGKGQALETPGLEKTAEEYLIRGEGPIGGTDYLWDQAIRKEMVDFLENGTLGTTLATGFDSNGEWIEMYQETLRPKMGSYGNYGFEQTAVIAKSQELGKDGMRKLLCDPLPEGGYHFKGKLILEAGTDYGDLRTAGIVIRKSGNLPESLLECAELREGGPSGLKNNTMGKKTHGLNTTIEGKNLKKVGEIKLPYLVILPRLETAGRIECQSLDAQTLETLEEILLENAERGTSSLDLNLPNLKKIGKLVAKTSRCVLPKLKEAQAIIVKSLEAPELELAGKVTWSEGTLTAPNLKARQTWGPIAKEETWFQDSDWEELEEIKLPEDQSFRNPEDQIETTEDEKDNYLLWAAEATEDEDGPKIIINAAAITADKVKKAMLHEIAHIAMSSKEGEDVKRLLEEAMLTLSSQERSEIEKELKAVYKGTETKNQEERLARVMEALNENAPRDLINKLTKALDALLQVIADIFDMERPKSPTKTAITAEVFAAAREHMQPKQTKKTMNTPDLLPL